MGSTLCSRICDVAIKKDHCYCFGMPASLITRAQRAVSVRMNCANSSRLVGVYSTTISVNRCCISGMRSTVVRSACTLSNMVTGVPVGAHRPYHELDSKPGATVSCTVGTSGICAMRVLLITASALTRLLWIDDSTPGADCTLTGICPAMTSVSACGAPL